MRFSALIMLHIAHSNNIIIAMVNIHFKGTAHQDHFLMTFRATKMSIHNKEVIKNSIILHWSYVTFIQLTSSIADNSCSILIEEVITYTAIGVVVADLNSSHSLTLTGLTSIHQPHLSISAVCRGSSGTCWACLHKVTLTALLSCPSVAKHTSAGKAPNIVSTEGIVVTVVSAIFTLVDV